MSEEVKVVSKRRIGFWAVAGILAAASVVILFINYRTLEQATLFSEKAAVSEARNFRYYVNEYHVTKVALDESNQKLLALTMELEKTNQELTLTRDELSSVQQINDQLKGHITTLEHFKEKALQRGEALESMIQSFKQKNRELDSALQGARKELAGFQPDISDVQEGRDKIKRFKDRIHAVKVNMGTLRQKAEEARKVAQKERDRVEMEYGNGGFMVKNGQAKAVNHFGEKRVDIDVKFINK